MIDNLEYNTEREHLIIPEYGRHLQKMINHAKTRETKEERNKLAKAIISVMGNLQPHLRDVPDFQHKLWDQLFIMSDFELDADSPYPKPSREELTAGPDPLKYPQNHPKYRFYGNNIKTMIDVACTWEEGDMKEALIYTIANHMKKCYLTWSQSSVDDATILKHFSQLSEEKLKLDEDFKLIDDIKATKKNSAKYTKHKRSQQNNKNKKKKY